MTELERLAQLQRRQYGLRPFPDRLEGEFRAFQRLLYRVPRAVLFAAIGLGFAIAPLYDVALLSPAPDVLPTVRLIEWGLVVPAMLWATASCVLRFSAPHAGLAQFTGVLCAWLGVLLLRDLSMAGRLQYPQELLGIVILGVAIFGGYRFIVVVAGSVLFTALGIALEYRRPHADSIALLHAYSLAYLLIIGVLSALTQEALLRIAWINHRYASALARTDALTDLASRAHFDRGFARLLAGAAGRGQSIAVLFVDLDEFKRINDAHGHLFGDDVIRRVGQALKESPAAQGFDLQARFGGEEFVLAATGMDLRQLEEAAEATLECVRQVALPQDAGIRLTASAGGIVAGDLDRATPEKLLEAADRLLYRAKAQGRDRAVVAKLGGPAAGEARAA